MTDRAGHPAGARAEPSAAPAGLTGAEFRRRARAVLAEQAAARRRGRVRRAARQPGPGMIRRPPPDSDDAA
jgi:hypothetical protein